MKIHYSVLTGKSLYWAVAHAMGKVGSYYCTRHGVTENVKLWRPSSNWMQGGPIIDENEITIDYREGQTLARIWCVEKQNFVEAYADKKQGLLAAMRCYVRFVVGDEIDVPDNLV